MNWNAIYEYWDTATTAKEFAEELSDDNGGIDTPRGMLDALARCPGVPRDAIGALLAPADFQYAHDTLQPLWDVYGGTALRPDEPFEIDGAFVHVPARAKPLTFAVLFVGSGNRLLRSVDVDVFVALSHPALSTIVEKLVLETLAETDRDLSYFPPLSLNPYLSCMYTPVDCRWRLFCTLATHTVNYDSNLQSIAEHKHFALWPVFRRTETSIGVWHFAMHFPYALHTPSCGWLGLLLILAEYQSSVDDTSAFDTCRCIAHLTYRNSPPALAQTVAARPTSRIAPVGIPLPAGIVAYKRNGQYVSADLLLLRLCTHNANATSVCGLLESEYGMRILRALVQLQCGREEGPANDAVLELYTQDEVKNYVDGLQNDVPAALAMALTVLHAAMGENPSASTKAVAVNEGLDVSTWKTTFETLSDVGLPLDKVRVSSLQLIAQDVAYTEADVFTNVYTPPTDLDALAASKIESLKMWSDGVRMELHGTMCNLPIMLFKDKLLRRLLVCLDMLLDDAGGNNAKLQASANALNWANKNVQPSNVWYQQITGIDSLVDLTAVPVAVQVQNGVPSNVADFKTWQAANVAASNLSYAEMQPTIVKAATYARVSASYAMVTNFMSREQQMPPDQDDSRDLLVAMAAYAGMLHDTAFLQQYSLMPLSESIKQLHDRDPTPVDVGPVPQVPVSKGVQDAIVDFAKGVFANEATGMPEHFAHVRWRSRVLSDIAAAYFQQRRSFERRVPDAWTPLWVYDKSIGAPGAAPNVPKPLPFAPHDWYFQFTLPTGQNELCVTVAPRHQAAQSLKRVTVTLRGGIVSAATAVQANNEIGDLLRSKALVECVQKGYVESDDALRQAALLRNKNVAKISAQAVRDAGIKWNQLQARFPLFVGSQMSVAWGDSDVVLTGGKKAQPRVLVPGGLGDAVGNILIDPIPGELVTLMVYALSRTPVTNYKTDLVLNAVAERAWQDRRKNRNATVATDLQSVLEFGPFSATYEKPSGLTRAQITGVLAADPVELVTMLDDYVMAASAETPGHAQPDAGLWREKVAEIRARYDSPVPRAGALLHAFVQKNSAYRETAAGKFRVPLLTARQRLADIVLRRLAPAAQDE